MGLFKARNPSLLQLAHSATRYFRPMVQQKSPKYPVFKAFRGLNLLSNCIKTL